MFSISCIYHSYFIRKQRYVYGTILDSIAKVTGVVKFDLHAKPDSGKTKLEVGGNVQGLYDLGPGKFGSEAVYVPRVPGTDSEEDDGYLILFAHDENTGYHFPLHFSCSGFCEIVYIRMDYNHNYDCYELMSYDQCNSLGIRNSCVWNMDHYDMTYF